MTGFRIIEGQEYTYTSVYPANCTGHTYRVLRFVSAVPSYQEQVVFEAVTGPDKGKWFVCSLHNFSTRYAPAEKETP